MGMKTSICETLPLIFAKEAAIAQDDMVDLIAGALAVKTMPFLRRLLTFSENAIVSNKKICSTKGKRI